MQSSGVNARHTCSAPAGNERIGLSLVNPSPTGQRAQTGDGKDRGQGPQSSPGLAGVGDRLS